MANETSNKPIEEIQKLEQYLPDEKKAELAQILTFGERIKAEWEKKKKEFWNEHLYDKEYFKDLLVQYGESKEKFIESLTPGEKKILDNLDESNKDKFYNEYLYERILYSWDINDESDYGYGWSIEYKNENWDFDLEKFKDWVYSSKDSLQPWMKIYLWDNKLWYEWAKILAKTWKDRLRPWMTIDLDGNNIWYKWAKILAKTWKDKLQPWMEIYLGNNNLWEKWVKILAETWKDNLQHWMEIILSSNNLWEKWVKILAETWKDKLKPWMTIDLGWNEIWNEWVKILAETWKDKIQPWMTIHLGWNEIWNEWVRVIMQNLKLKEWVSLNFIWNNEISDEMKTQLKEWVQWYRDQWIEVDCGVLL